MLKTKTKMAANMENGLSGENIEGIDPNSVLPVFIKTHDLGTRITGYKLGTMINDQIGNTVVEGIQEVRSLWRVYPLTLEGRQQICEQGFKINNRTVKCYMQNPYATGLIANGIDKGYDENKPMTKVTICDLYKSV